MLNQFKEPQKAILKVQQTLETIFPSGALFLDLSKAFERVNAHWILLLLYIKQPPYWVIAIAKHLLFGRRICHKVQGRLLPPRRVYTGVGRHGAIYVGVLFLLSDGPHLYVSKSNSRSYPSRRVCRRYYDYWTHQPSRQVDS